MGPRGVRFSTEEEDMMHCNLRTRNDQVMFAPLHEQLWSLEVVVRALLDVRGGLSSEDLARRLLEHGLAKGDQKSVSRRLTEVLENLRLRGKVAREDGQYRVHGTWVLQRNFR